MCACIRLESVYAERDVPLAVHNRNPRFRKSSLGRRLREAIGGSIVRDAMEQSGVF